MMDWHAHVLQGMDDGARDTATSIQMLQDLLNQGITEVAATSHFYGNEENIEEFLERRERAYEHLWEKSKGIELPDLYLGAEVYYYDGISYSEDLYKLRMECSDILLLEMPWCTWTDRMIREIQNMQSDPDIKVMLAHVERYFPYQAPNKPVWDELLNMGILMQSNAEFFLNWRTKRTALKLLKEGRIHFLGTDCHNMGERSPKLGEAIQVIQNKLGEIPIQRIESMETYLLER